jgi:hypothetical protein
VTRSGPTSSAIVTDLRSDRGNLAAALARFAGSANDFARFMFLLVVTDGEGSGGQSPCFCPGSRGD